MVKCNFCGREFVKEKTLYSHLCAKGQRHKNKDLKHVQIGFQIYQKFYKVMLGERTSKTYDEFASSPYYNAFIRWGKYVMDTKCLNTMAFGNWLIKNAVPIDKWATDSIYTKWLIDWVYVEDHWDSTTRCLETMAAWADENKSVMNHYFNYASNSRVIADITCGRITGWVIYCSESGQKWISSLDPSEISLIWPLVNADKWQKKFQDHRDTKKEILELCSEAGL